MRRHTKPQKRTILFFIGIVLFLSMPAVLRAGEDPATIPLDVICASWDKKIGINVTSGAREILTVDDEGKTPVEERGAYSKIFCLNGSNRAMTATGSDATDPTFNANVLPNKGIQFLQYALSFLAIIGVAMILWGGFTWMTSGGNDQTVDRARKILLAALIGLVIITSAWVIVSFVVKLGQSSIGT